MASHNPSLGRPVIGRRTAATGTEAQSGNNAEVDKRQSFFFTPPATPSPARAGNTSGQNTIPTPFPSALKTGAQGNRDQGHAESPRSVTFAIPGDSGSPAQPSQLVSLQDVTAAFTKALTAVTQTVLESEGRMNRRIIDLRTNLEARIDAAIKASEAKAQAAHATAFESQVARLDDIVNTQARALRKEVQKRCSAMETAAARGMEDHSAMVMEQLEDVNTAMATLKASVDKVEQNVAGLRRSMEVAGNGLQAVEQRAKKVEESTAPLAERVAWLASRVDGVPEAVLQLRSEMGEVIPLVKGMGNRLDAEEQRSHRLYISSLAAASALTGGDVALALTGGSVALDPSNHQSPNSPADLKKIHDFLKAFADLTADHAARDRARALCNEISVMFTQQEATRTAV